MPPILSCLSRVYDAAILSQKVREMLPANHAARSIEFAIAPRIAISIWHERQDHQSGSTI